MKMSLNEAAAHLGKSVRQIRYMVSTGRLPATKHAGRWMTCRCQGAWQGRGQLQT
jgi:hypothetical protein